MKLIIITVIILLVMLVWAFLFDRSLPKKYRNRKCTGRNWKNSFPNSSNEDIRSFLVFFTDAFAFSNKSKFKFEPEDKLLEIYRELYPLNCGTDALEFETELPPF